MHALLIIGAGVLAGAIVMMVLRKGSAAPAPPLDEVTPAPEPPYIPPTDPTPRPPKADTDGRQPTPPIQITFPPSVPLPPINFYPSPEPDLPGMTPDNPIPSKSVGNGFQGFILIEEGDNLYKLASRLGTTHNDLINHPLNWWARDKCPKWVKNQWNNGLPTIALLPRYGKTPGYDCAAPGYNATLYSQYTGQHVVVAWDWSQGGAIGENSVNP